MNNVFDGRIVKIRANDFIASDLIARIRLTENVSRTMLLELDLPLNVNGTSYKYALASPRLMKEDLVDLLDNGVLGSSITWVPDKKFDATRPLDVSWWRGGAAAITDVCLA